MRRGLDSEARSYICLSIPHLVCFYQRHYFGSLQKIYDVDARLIHSGQSNYIRLLSLCPSSSLSATISFSVSIFAISWRKNFFYSKRIIAGKKFSPLNHYQNIMHIVFARKKKTNNLRHFSQFMAIKFVFNFSPFSLFAKYSKAQFYISTE